MGQVLSIFGQLKGLFYSGVIIDDPVFKLHYGFTTYLLLFMTFLSVGKVFLAEPMYCTLNTRDWTYQIPKELLNSYCYIHSTYIIPTNHNFDKDLFTNKGHGPIGDDHEEVVFHSCKCAVWKSNYFSITQILCEINFGDSTSAKSAILTHLKALKVSYEFLHFLKAEFYQIEKNLGPQNSKNSNFRAFRFSKIDFT